MLSTTHSSGEDRASAPVVLVHGFLSSARDDFVENGWLRRLSAANRRAMAVDLPAHGVSGAPLDTAGATTTAVVDALARTIAHFYPGEEVDVVAYSLGSRLAWELPAAGAPIRRLVLGGLSLMDPFAGRDAATLTRALGGGAPDPFTGMIAGMIAGSGQDPEPLIALVAGLGTEPFDPAGNPPAVPVLLAGGTDDQLVTGLSDLAPTLPDARFVAVPGDHVAALASVEFWDAAIGFLSPGR
ncbi:MAG: alpha/beta fold hydrolase [Microbacterium sp.]